MERASKLMLFSSIITAAVFIFTLVSSRGGYSLFLLLIMVFALVMCYCFKDRQYASMFSLFNLILAVNAFDLVGLIIIGSKISHYSERLWGGPFTSHNIFGILIFLGHAILSYLGWLLYSEYSMRTAVQTGGFPGQPATFDNGNGTGVVGDGQFDNWERRDGPRYVPFQGDGVRVG
jgi:NADH:ubiquinone oxidoreductase subunit 6 (subunit J)